MFSINPGIPIPAPASKKISAHLEFQEMTPTNKCPTEFDPMFASERQERTDPADEAAA
jgi:hypothetical protein